MFLKAFDRSLRHLLGTLGGLLKASEFLLGALAGIVGSILFGTHLALYSCPPVVSWVVKWLLVAAWVQLLSVVERVVETLPGLGDCLWFPGW